ncbi:MAG: ATP-binding cassette domain-containing protein, partial [Rikenellaceae bacterium]
DRVCNRILELDNSGVYSYNGNYNYYLQKRQERLDAAASQHESDRNLYRKELDWMRRQPQARATKAKSRIESFHELENRLRKERELGAVNLNVKASYIGKKIFEVEDLCKRYDSKIILDKFNYTFARYEKMGIVGENGVGKSTFIKMLLGEVQPDSGKIDVGSTVKFGYYSQQGGVKFNDQTKVIDVVSDIAEHIEFSDGTKLGASQFLQHFLFEPKTQHNYVCKLSGGELRRLYLCTVLMQNPNFLILDEPTNDLDIMTLQVLEEYLQGFSGCVIVVSHDRYFMDKVADHLLVFEGEGKIKDFPSSYTDFIVWSELRDAELRANAAPVQSNDTRKNDKKQAEKANKLTYKERRELENLEKELADLEQEKSEIESQLASGTLAIDVLTEKSVRISQIIDGIDEKSMRWLELSEKEQ